jgi:hypothetical protein
MRCKQGNAFLCTLFLFLATMAVSSIANLEYETRMPDPLCCERWCLAETVLYREYYLQL